MLTLCATMLHLLAYFVKKLNYVNFNVLPISFNQNLKLFTGLKDIYLQYLDFNLYQL